MKKTIIAGAAATVLAAMPVVGVFAANPVDTVTLKVTGACSITNTEDDAKDVELTGTGNSGVFGGEDGTAGTTFTVNCNTKDGWSINANATNLESDDGATIPFGGYSDTGNSVWSAMIKLVPNTAEGSTATIKNNWGTFEGDKSEGDIQIVESKEVTSGVAAGVSNLTVTPYYKAYVANQPEGEYEATVTYTLTASEPTVE